MTFVSQFRCVKSDFLFFIFVTQWDVNTWLTVVVVPSQCSVILWFSFDQCIVGTLCSCLHQAHKDGSLQQLLSGEKEAYDYDLIVIGGGSGGLACSKVI